MVTEAHLNALRSYSARGFIKINNGLREGRDFKSARLIDDMMVPLDRPRTVYRAMSLAELQGKAESGRVVTNKAFLSTSVDSNMNFAIARRRQVHVTLHVPVGIRGVYIPQYVRYSHDKEKELLLQRNLQWTIQDVIERNGRIHLTGQVDNEQLTC